MELEIAVAAVIIAVLVILLLAALIHYGTKEKPFEDAVREKQGLTLLLADDKTKTTGKKTVKVKKDKVKADDHRQTHEKKRTVSHSPDSASIGKDVGSGLSLLSDSEKHVQPEKEVGVNQQKAKEQKPSAKDDVVVAGEVKVEASTASLSAKGVVNAVPSEKSNALDSADDGATAASDPTDASKKKKEKKKKDKQPSKLGLSVDGISDADRQLSQRPSVSPQGSTPGFRQDKGKINTIIDQLAVANLNEHELGFLVEFLQANYSSNPVWFTSDPQKADQVHQLTRVLREKEQELAQHVANVKIYEKQFQDDNQQINAEKSRTRAVEKQLQQYVEQHKLLQSQYQDIAAKGQQAMAEMAANRTNFDKVHFENRQMASQIQQHKTDLQRVNGLLSRAENEAAHAKSQLQKASADANVACQKLRLNEEEMRKLGTRVHEVDKHHHEELENLRKDRAALEKAVAGLKEELAKSVSVNGQKHGNGGGDDFEKVAVDLSASREKVAHLEKELKQLAGQNSQLNQAVEKLQAEVANYSSGDASRYKELEHALNAKNSLEAELVKLRSALKSAEQQHSAEKSKLQQSVESLSSQHKALESAKQRLEADLRKLQEKSHPAPAETLAEVSAQRAHISPSGDHANAALLEDALVGREKALTKLEAELSDWQHRYRDTDRALAEARTEVNRLVDQQSETSTHLQKLRAENISLLEQLRVQALEATSGDTGNASESSRNERDDVLIQSLKQQIAKKDAEIAHLQEKNNELREKNYKVIESLAQTEKNAYDLALKKEKAVEDKYKGQFASQSKDISDLVALVAPSVKLPPVSNLLPYREWLQDVHDVVKRELSARSHDAVSLSPSAKGTPSKAPKQDAEELRSQLSSAIAEKCEIASQLSHYKCILSQTEQMLQKLEQSVESEHSQLHRKCEVLEKELHSVQNEKAANLISLASTEEVKRQLTELKVKLESEERERIQLKKEIEKLTSELSSERNAGRELSSQTIKLKGMLKTGQDALRQEQELVSQLQKQLDSYVANKAVNGSVSELLTSQGREGIETELQELRAKLNEREAQLEREMLINKQLNGKLVSLGMTGSLHSPISL